MSSVISPSTTQTSCVLKGNIIWSRSQNAFSIADDAYLVCVDGYSRGVYQELPSEFSTLPLLDYSGHIIMPGMIDLHVHAPQYSYRGLGLDMELLEWLNTYAFPEEAKYEDLAYAQDAYAIFVSDLVKSPTTRAAIFASKHVPATYELMDQLEATGLITYVGKVNMDRNATPELEEADAACALTDTEAWIQSSLERYKRTFPILTPRFTPSCTDELMYGLGKLKEKYGLRLQSHLSENRSEVQWVQELAPWAQNYTDTYFQTGQLLPYASALMAHCVCSDDAEIAMLKETGCYVAHCPESNTCLASGIAPVRRFLDAGVNVGLGTDVAGGPHLSLFSAAAAAINVSKLRWVYLDPEAKPLTIEEALWLATRGGGSFFGRVGSFDQDFEFDALVIDDGAMKTMLQLSTKERLERVVYNEKEGAEIVAKFVRGVRVV